MLYIFVGPDGAGKSTCFEALKSMQDFRDQHAIFIKESHTKDEDDKRMRLERMERLKVVSHSVPVFYDRATAIDDLVYKPVIDRAASSLKGEEVVKALTGTTVIYFKADVDALAERIGERGDDWIVNPTTLAEVMRRYDGFMKDCRVMNACQVYTVDTTTATADETAKKVLDIVRGKSMKFAHIVPVSCLDVLQDKQYVMCLAHLVKADDRYRKFYAQFAQRKGTFVLMDNGAAEHQQLSNDELLECYDMIGPSEIVLPDTLCDANSTLAKMRGALDLFVEQEHLPYRIMAVPQGKTIGEWRRCAIEMVKDRRINTIGVSKFLQMVTGDAWARYNAVEILGGLMNEYDRHDLEVHLLGCSEPLSVVYKIATTFPFVRGCDSALGYLFAQAGIHPQMFTRRPDGEIEFIDGAEIPGLAEYLSDVEVAAGIYDNYNNDPSWR